MKKTTEFLYKKYCIIEQIQKLQLFKNMKNTFVQNIINQITVKIFNKKNKKE